MNKGIETIQEKIGSVFSDQEKCGIAYLYGSRARGESGESSDYDFAKKCIDSDEDTKIG